MRIRELEVASISPDIKFRLGQPLDASKRIAYYRKLGFSQEAFKNFPMHVAYAVDTEVYPVLTIIAMTHIEMLIHIVRIVLESVFKDQGP